MTISEAARELGLSPATLRRQIDNGRLRAEKHGTQWWVTPAAVEAYRKNVKGRVGRRPGGAK